MSRFDRLEFEPRPDHSGAPNVPGSSSHQHADLTEAERLRLEADHDEHYWLHTATEERRNGNHEGALRSYSRALEVNKSLPAGWVGQVQMLIALGEYPEAALWAGKALEMFRNNAELLAGRAQALCRSGDLKAAQASCDAAIGQQGMFSYPWAARGELMLARNQDTAEHCFDKAVQIDGDWLVTLEIAWIYLHYHRPAKAHVRARRALEAAPDRAYCWFCQGECQMALGLSDGASRSFARCLELAPRHAEARARMAELVANPKPVRQFFRRLFRRS